MAAGYDLFPQEGSYQCIPPGCSTVISLGIASAFDYGWVALIQDRSSMGLRGIIKRAGVIDCDYRGEWKVILYNSGTEDIEIRSDKAVAQVIFVPCCMETPLEVTELPKSERDTSGFGSTDQKGN